MSDEDRLRQQNFALCNALADMTARMYAAERRYKTSVEISTEAERLLMGLLLESGPERMVIGDRRVLIQAAERLRRIQRIK